MKKFSKICKFCGDTFYPVRSDAMYCCASCRARASRRIWVSGEHDINPVYIQLNKEDYARLSRIAFNHNFTVEEFVTDLIKHIINGNRKRTKKQN